MTIYNLVSFLGIFVLVGLGWIFSANRRTMNWRVIGVGIALQLVFACFIFQAPAGAKVFEFVNQAVVKVLDSASRGTDFVFGRLAIPPGGKNADGESSLGFILAFQALPTIVFFSALMSVLYFWRIMPWVIKGFAWVFTRLMRVSGAESLSTATNIFVGIESMLTIRPHLEKMTRSELCTILTAGMATVASNVLGLYVMFLRKDFPNVAGHLVSASIIAAPAALVMSKVLLPETGQPETMGTTIEVSYSREKTLFEAIINGANAGLQLIFGIVALLLAVLGLIALVDLFLGGIGWRLNVWAGWHVDWSLKGLLGYLFYPLTLILGVPPADAYAISKVIGERSVATEVAGYRDLAVLLANGSLQCPGRSAIIATYALCGFAHVASLAIFVGGTAALVPSRASDLARVGFRALVAATLACLMTACMAGVFTGGDSSILLGTGIAAPAP